MTLRERKTKLWLGFGGLLVVLLLAAVFTLGSLNMPFEPRHWNEVVILYALSAIIVAALMVFGLILTRTLLRLWAERRAEQLGSRFKTKMVLGAMAISLLPVLFMFYVSYGLLNRTLNRWFPRPLEIAVDESQKLLLEMGKAHHDRLTRLATEAARREAPEAKQVLTANAAVDAAWTIAPGGQVLDVQIFEWHGSERGVALSKRPATLPHLVQTLPSGAEIWAAGGKLYMAGRAPVKGGALMVGRQLPEDFLSRYTAIQNQMLAYHQEGQRLRTLKNQMLLELFLFTLLLLLAATWFALFLSKQVTVPIQALAEATREVTAGNFDVQVQEQAQDELGILVRSFNLMTAQLGDSRRQIDEFTRSLQQAVQELERRRKLMEAILENIPTGVLSLDEAGEIVRLNPAAANIFGETSRTARTLEGLVGEEAAHGVHQLMRRSLRMGVASKELEIVLPGRLLHAAVTVSSLGPRRSNPGFVIVVDDLTELLRAQKAAAWQQVAQRIAHEIKNPLTPIQLSAQRLNRHLERRRAGTRSGERSGASGRRMCRADRA